MAESWHETLHKTGVAFFHGITDINLDSVNPVKGNLNGNISNMERSKLKKDFLFYCGELSTYIWLISIWTITHRVATSLRSQLKGRCQDQSKIKSRKSIVIKPPFLGVPEAVWSERTPWAGWRVVRHVLEGDRSRVEPHCGRRNETGTDVVLQGGDNWLLLMLNGILITSHLTDSLSHWSCIMIRTSSYLERSNLLWWKNNSW